MSTNNPKATKIMIVRHAEKPPDNPPPYGVTARKGKHDEESLTVRGWQRAGALASFFAPQDGRPLPNPSVATPQYVYASKVEDKKVKGEKVGSKSKRPQQTITPLVELLGANVTTDFTIDKGDEEALAASAAACEGVVLICWEHQSITAIVSHLPLSPGTTPPAGWPDDAQGQGRFDLVWVFDLQESGAYDFTQVPQCLLAGDSPD
jgi:hypothetical protein